MSIVTFSAGDTDYIEKLNKLSQQAGDVAALKNQAEQAAKTAATDAVALAKTDLQGYVAAAAGHAATVDVPVELANAATINVPENQATITILCTGSSGTINLPATPGLKAIYKVRTHQAKAKIQVNTDAGNNTHNITSLKGKVATNLNIQGAYDLILFWDGTGYKEMF